MRLPRVLSLPRLCRFVCCLIAVGALAGAQDLVSGWNQPPRDARLRAYW